MRSCFTPPRNSSLAADPSTYWASVINFLSLLFLFICLVFFVCTLRQDNSALLLTQELCALHTLRPKLIILNSTLAPVLFRLSGIPCLMKLNTFSQSLHLKPLWRPICLNLILLAGNMAQSLFDENKSVNTNCTLKKNNVDQNIHQNTTYQAKG